MKLPMTFCLTFDDGFKVHHDIAAPMLEARGWRGASNVPTEFMYSDHTPLTPIQIKDCYLEGNESNLMDWDDVRDLVRRGHEVYPHTLGHVDLLQLEKAGRVNELRRQIVESKRQFVEQLGYVPRFFASPHNSKSKLIEAEIRREGMEIFSCGRRNFPNDPYGHYSTTTIAQYVKKEYYNGTSHIDIMIHGIDASLGGWEPFETASEFERFLDNLKRLENSGYVRVVPYSLVHAGPGLFLHARNCTHRIMGKLRRMVFSLYGNHE